MVAPSPVPHRAQQVHAIQKGMSREKVSKARKIAARGIATLIAFFISSHLLDCGVGLEMLWGGARYLVYFEPPAAIVTVVVSSLLVPRKKSPPNTAYTPYYQQGKVSNLVYAAARS